MPIRETRGGLSRSPRDRWPLDTTTELISQEGNVSPVPLVQNHFTVDGPGAGLGLTPAQKKALLDQLLREAADTAGQTIDLSKPILPPRPAPGTFEFEYPKLMYQHQSGHMLQVDTPEQEKAALAQGFKTKPAPDRDYSQAKVGKIAPMKPPVAEIVLPADETINVEELATAEEAAAAEQAGVPEGLEAQNEAIPSSRKRR